MLTSKTDILYFELFNAAFRFSLGTLEDKDLEKKKAL
jgi:hypothetical protein